MRFFETLRSDNGTLHHLEYHQRRMARTIDGPPELSKILSPPHKGTYRCRLHYDEENYAATYLPYTFNIPQSLQLIRDDTISYTFKYTDRSALDALHRGHCDDVLIVSKGLLRDTSIANIALRDSGRWYTPLHPLLEGTTRARLIEQGRLHVRDIPLDTLHTYDALALMNAMTGFVMLQNGIMAINK